MTWLVSATNQINLRLKVNSGLSCLSFKAKFCEDGFLRHNLEDSKGFFVFAVSKHAI
jgi:hypothetical protein